MFYDRPQQRQADPGDSDCAAHIEQQVLLARNHHKGLRQQRDIAYDQEQPQFGWAERGESNPLEQPSDP